MTKAKKLIKIKPVEPKKRGKSTSSTTSIGNLNVCTTMTSTREITPGSGYAVLSTSFTCKPTTCVPSTTKFTTWQDIHRLNQEKAKASERDSPIHLGLCNMLGSVRIGYPNRGSATVTEDRTNIPMELDDLFSSRSCPQVQTCKSAKRVAIDSEIKIPTVPLLNQSIQTFKKIDVLGEIRDNQTTRPEKKVKEVTGLITLFQNKDLIGKTVNERKETPKGATRSIASHPNKHTTGSTALPPNKAAFSKMGNKIVVQKGKSYDKQPKAKVRAVQGRTVEPKKQQQSRSNVNLAICAGMSKDWSSRDGNSSKPHLVCGPRTCGQLLPHSEKRQHSLPKIHPCDEKNELVLKAIEKSLMVGHGLRDIPGFAATPFPDMDGITATEQSIRRTKSQLEFQKSKLLERQSTRSCPHVGTCKLGRRSTMEDKEQTRKGLLSLTRIRKGSQLRIRVAKDHTIGDQQPVTESFIEQDTGPVLQAAVKKVTADDETGAPAVDVFSEVDQAYTTDLCQPATKEDSVVKSIIEDLSCSLKKRMKNLSRSSLSGVSSEPYFVCGPSTCKPSSSKVTKKKTFSKKKDTVDESVEESSLGLESTCKTKTQVNKAEKLKRRTTRTCSLLRPCKRERKVLKEEKVKFENEEEMKFEIVAQLEQEKSQAETKRHVATLTIPCSEMCICCKGSPCTCTEKIGETEATIEEQIIEAIYAVPPEPLEPESTLEESRKLSLETSHLTTDTDVVFKKIAPVEKVVKRKTSKPQYTSTKIPSKVESVKDEITELSASESTEKTKIDSISLKSLHGEVVKRLQERIQRKDRMIQPHKGGLISKAITDRERDLISEIVSVESQIMEIEQEKQLAELIFQRNEGRTKEQCECIRGICTCPGSTRLPYSAQGLSFEEKVRIARHMGFLIRQGNYIEAQRLEALLIGDPFAGESDVSGSCICYNEATPHYLSPASSTTSCEHKATSISGSTKSSLPGECTCPKYNRTVAIISPNGMPYKDVILRAILNEGLDIVHQRILHLTPEQVSEIYPQSYGKSCFPLCLLSMSVSPVLVLALAGINAVDRWNNMVGPDKVVREEWFLPRSIRLRFGIQPDIPNVLHASENLDEANTENRYFFLPSTLDPILAEGSGVNNYFDKYVQPTLIKGLATIARVKPQDPIWFLAAWLVSNNPFQPRVPKHVAYTPL